MKFIYVLLFMLVQSSINFSNSQRVSRSGSKEPDFITGRLTNGFTYAIRRNETQKQKAFFQFVVKAGFLNEDRNQFQAAHVLEHLFFSTPMTGANRSVNDYFISKGLNLGNEYTASTGFDQTLYRFEVEASDSGLVSELLKYLRAWAGRVKLPEEIVAAQRGAVLSENRLGVKSADGRTAVSNMARLLEGSKMGNILATDALSAIVKLTAADVQNFYDTWYQPNRMALIVSGDIDVDHLESQIRQCFDGLKNSVKTTEIYNQPVLPKEPRMIMNTDPAKDGTDLQLVWKQLNPVVKTTFSEKDKLLCRMMDLMQKNRAANLQRSDPLSAQPNISISGALFMEASRLSAISAELRVNGPDSVKAGLFRMLTSIEQLKRYGYTTAEFSRAKKMLNDELSDERLTDQAFVYLMSDQFVYRQTLQKPDEIRTRNLHILSGITLQEINMRLARWLSNKNYELLITTADRNAKKIDGIDSVKQWVAAAGSSRISAPVLSEIRSRSLSEEVRLTNIAVPDPTITDDKTLGTRTIKIGGGVTIILRPMTNGPFMGDVWLRVFSARGDAGNSPADRLKEQAATYMAQNGGVGSFARKDLINLSAERATQLNPYISKQYAGFAGSGDLETMLQLMWLYLHAPQKDNITYAKWVTEKAQSRFPEAQDSLRRYRGFLAHADEDAPADTQLPDLQQVFSFSRRVFDNLDNLTFVICGPFKLSEAQSLVLKYASDIRLTETRRNLPERSSVDLNTLYPPERVVRIGSLKDAAKIEMRFTGTFEDRPENYVLGSLARRLLYRKMFDRLREREGGTYYVNTGFGVQKSPGPFFTALVGFESTVAGEQKLLAAAWEEIEALKTHGPTPSELDIIKKQEAKDLSSKAADAYFWIDYLESQLKEARDLHEFFDQQNSIDRISAEDIREFIKRYYTKSNFYLIEAASAFNSPAGTVSAGG